MREADRRKDEFLATLAHELRNPLAPIRNGLQILSKRAGPHDETVHQTVTMMQRQMSHLVRLVDDLLDVGRITRGKLELKLQRMAIGDLVRSAVEASRTVFEAAGHTFRSHIASEPLLVDVDPDRLVQVIANLLTNASKFTAPGGRIDLNVTRQDEHVIIEVHDTGIGIAAHELERVFEPFIQLASPDSRTQGGLGIGLSLVRELVHMHGGAVAALSDGPEKGSTFIVRLPLATRVADQTFTPLDRSPSRKSQAARRILVVDDNADAATSLAMLLEIEGHEVSTASNGEAAIAQVDTFRPDAIFMDVGMPVMDGLEATRRIRELKMDRRILIVALTGWGQESDRDRTSEAGMNHHLVKPVSAEDLRELLAKE